MNDANKTKSIWKTIQGSEELHELYGYYPTLHDASITNFDVKFENKQITLTFEYSDLIQKETESDNENKELATKIIICWKSISESKIQIYNNDVYDVCFDKIGNKIKTLFSQSAGTHGHIISEKIEIISVEKSKCYLMSDKNDYLNTVKFSFDE